MSSTTEPELLSIPPESALGQALRDAAEAGRNVLIDTGEARYEIEIHRAMALEQDTERATRVMEAIRKAKGAWRGNVDTEAFTAYIYERRRTANRPSWKI